MPQINNMRAIRMRDEKKNFYRTLDSLRGYLVPFFGPNFSKTRQIPQINKTEVV